MGDSEIASEEQSNVVSIQAEEIKKAVTFSEEKVDWEKHKKSASSIGIWLGFCVGIALTPVLSNWLISGAVKQAFSMQMVLGHGELLAISVAIMGEAMGYLLTNPNVNSTFKAVVGLGCLLELLASAFLLGALTIDKLTFDTSYITNVSFLLFAITLIVGSFCKWTEK